MITSYSAGLYDALFKKAEERLNNVFNMNVTIDDLETYFYHLRDLVYGPEDAPATEEQIKEGYIFLKLPAVEQEGHFIIDANTRKIDTSGFKGLLSVQGDEIAEIVFFEIDRFFDATDLNLMDIAIQWSYRDGNSTVQGYTPAFIKYIEPVHDKLVFGWPITSDVTAKAGALTFSVRFYKIDSETKKQMYNFTTLEAVMNIGSSLQVNIAELKTDDPAKTILGRLMNSNLDGVEDLTPPWFVYAQPEPEEEIGVVTSDLHLCAAAATSKTRNVTYKWYYPQEIDGNTQLMSTDGWTEANCYKPVNNRIPDIFTYYYQDKGSYTLVNINDDQAFNSYKDKGLYILCTEYIIKPSTVYPGTYYVDARSYKNMQSAYASGADKFEKKDLSKMKSWVVLGPKEISLVAESWKQTQEGFNPLSVDGGDTTDENTKYEWQYSKNGNEDTYEKLDGVSGNSHTPTKEGFYRVVLTNSLNNASTSLQTEPCEVLESLDENAYTVTIEKGESNYCEAKITPSIESPFITVEYEWTKYVSRDDYAIIPEATGNILDLNLCDDNTSYVKVVATIKKGTGGFAGDITKSATLLISE